MDRACISIYDGRSYEVVLAGLVEAGRVAAQPSVAVIRRDGLHVDGTRACRVVFSLPPVHRYPRSPARNRYGGCSDT